MVIIHVILALGSLVLAFINYFTPSGVKLRISYGLAFGTLVSGTSLVFLNNASILRTCVTGIIFFAAVSTLNQAAHRKLSSPESDIL